MTDRVTKVAAAIEAVLEANRLATEWWSAGEYHELLRDMAQAAITAIETAGITPDGQRWSHP